MAETKLEPIKFLKIRDVKSPSRAFTYDAGIDFYVPKFNKEFIKDLKEKNSQFGSDNYIESSGSDTSSSGCNTLLSNSTFVVSSGTSSYPKSEVRYELNDNNHSTIKFDEELGLNYFNLAPHQRILIPSGIKSRMANPGRALIASNKSGVATKHGLVFGAQVVDYTYKGEIHLSVINTSTKLVRIYEDMKILQFVETPVFFSNIEITDPIDGKYNITHDEFYKGLEDDRKDGGFGHTDKK